MEGGSSLLSIMRGKCCYALLKFSENTPFVEYLRGLNMKWNLKTSFSSANSRKNINKKLNIHNLNDMKAS